MKPSDAQAARGLALARRAPRQVLPWTTGLGVMRSRDARAHACRRSALERARGVRSCGMAAPDRRPPLRAGRRPEARPALFASSLAASGSCGRCAVCDAIANGWYAFASSPDHDLAVEHRARRAGAAPAWRARESARVTSSSPRDQIQTWPPRLTSCARMPSYFHSTSQSAGRTEQCVEMLRRRLAEGMREEEGIGLAGEFRALFAAASQGAISVRIAGSGRLRPICV